MEGLILAISIVSSACGGMFGVSIWHKHSQKLLTPKVSTVDYFLGNPTTAALLITFLGALGFWLPSTLLPELLVVVEQPGNEEVRTSDRSSQPEHSFPVIDAVPLGEKQ